MPVVPPPNRVQPVLRRTIRYQGAAGSATVTQKSLLSIMIFGNGGGGGSTAGYSLVEGIKLRKLKIWCLDSDTATQTVTLVWFGASAGSRISASGNNTFPARMQSKPPPGSLASFWLEHTSTFTSQAAAQGIVAITSSVDYIMDIDVDMVLENGACALLAGTGITATSVSYPFLDSLDIAGTAQGSSLLAAVGLTGVTTLTNRTG